MHQGEELVAAPVESGAATRPSAESDENVDVLRTACWHCGAPYLNVRNDSCPHCHQPQEPPALIIPFPVGSVVLPASPTSVELGRAGEYGQLFAHHPNVSRRHATVTVDAAGEAWITPIPEAPNGTFVNDQEIIERTRIQQGDRIRFATDQGPHPGPVSSQIRQPRCTAGHLIE
ncbi:FHA domain-containing protein [Solwaraspora sp. WMMB335]|uniref:FHA domain-containing protein n=1 Tax=Solwaraspora sp. WMMB335 TaxID=3404118 RepID=UPI003B93DCD0